MNKSESKYYSTAARMDQAFLELLDKKDIEYITIKELCATAKVNRSTFYLHYESIGDLLEESVQYFLSDFYSHMKPTSDRFADKIRICPLEELYLITPEYLMPYLSYIAGHKRLFRTMLKKSESLRLYKAYHHLFENIFRPILERFQVPEKEQGYMMTFYMNGLMAIVSEWLEYDCADPIEQICTIMEHCVMGRKC